MLAEKMRATFIRDKKLRVLFLFDPEGHNKEEVGLLAFDNICEEVFDGRDCIRKR